MLDQYGEPVPDDLVVLDLDPSNLIREEREKIVNARWYELRNILLVSFAEIGELTETDPVDAGLTLDELVLEARGETLFYVDDRLKRYNEIDGFYHA